jgi:RimJ/RimL family protein N-acetyltransferase
MISHHVSAALGTERRNALLAEAEAARQARQARTQLQRSGASLACSPRRRWLRSSKGKRIVLRDGSRLLIRPVHSADAPLLADGFARLSDRSRRMRFMTTKIALSPAELRYFTDVDHHDHEALGALSCADGLGVGIARYVRDAEDPQAAEVAVTIVDDWQGRGLGTELMAQLSDRARREGIRRFTALVNADNTAVEALLRKMSAELIGRESSTMQYAIPLWPGESGRPSCAA